MTDGSTGFHVAPITEEDMFKVKDILQRAADAIVGMSQLSADVDMLRSTVTGLQADTDRLRSQNNALDEALNYSRSERDRLASELGHVKAELAEAKAMIDTTQFQRDHLEMEAGQLQIDLNLTRKAKDDAEFKVLELEEALVVSRTKANKIEAAFKDIFGYQMSPVEAKPEAEKVSEPIKADYSTDPMGSEPAPVTDTRPDSRDDWESGYYWDSGTGRYWRNGLIPSKPVHDPDGLPGY